MPEISEPSPQTRTTLFKLQARQCRFIVSDGRPKRSSAAVRLRQVQAGAHGTSAWSTPSPSQLSWELEDALRENQRLQSHNSASVAKIFRDGWAIFSHTNFPSLIRYDISIIAYSPICPLIMRYAHKHVVEISY
ncbi:hypothetical protein [Microvirga yunnanensis]|uniref:hypothetical protein n=1 Tax=Microvirga yunnanensis TaxID=2953740 RepID=UPI0021C97FAC|nr:hypothetical protein [Microvirga sp. HBU65207]